jgi:hypothetical protein
LDDECLLASLVFFGGGKIEREAGSFNHTAPL